MEEFEKYFSEKILNVKRLNSNIKNRLFKISLSNGNSYFLKKYSTIEVDKWNRGQTEFKAINYLRNIGFKEIPKPISFDIDKNVGIYSFENGKIIDPADVGEDYILKLVDFFVRLHKLPIKDKKQFLPASRACLSLRDYLKFIDNKIKYIKGGIPQQDSSVGVRFLSDVLSPKILKLKENFLNKVIDLEIDLDKELPIEKQVLAFTDFGFHNILFDNDKATFIDFEYFGRDDPVKEVLLFLHHPKSRDIKPELKKLFLIEYCKRINNQDFLERIELIEPLIKLIWVIVNLNVLSNEYMKHFKFSHDDKDERYFERLIESRIQESRKMLKEL